MTSWGIHSAGSTVIPVAIYSRRRVQLAKARVRLLRVPFSKKRLDRQENGKALQFFLFGSDRKTIFGAKECASVGCAVRGCALQSVGVKQR